MFELSFMQSWMLLTVIGGIWVYVLEVRKDKRDH